MISTLNCVSEYKSYKPLSCTSSMPILFKTVNVQHRNIFQSIDTIYFPLTFLSTVHCSCIRLTNAIQASLDGLINSKFTPIILLRSGVVAKHAKHAKALQPILFCFQYNTHHELHVCDCIPSDGKHSSCCPILYGMYFTGMRSWGWVWPRTSCQQT